MHIKDTVGSNLQYILGFLIIVGIIGCSFIFKNTYISRTKNHFSDTIIYTRSCVYRFT